MPGKINVYNLGVKGVVVDKSDVHTEDGELARAQNWQIDRVGGLGGIRRRDGLAALNDPLAGPVLGGIGVPLPDGEPPRIFYLPLNSGACFWKTSPDGTTWTDTGAPSRAVTLAKMGATALAFGDAAMRWQGFDGKLYYPGNDYELGSSMPTIHVWDGVDDLVLAYIPENPHGGSVARFGVSSLLPYSDTELLVCVIDRDGGTGRMRVLRLDVRNGNLVQLGPETDLTTGYVINGIAIWQGRIWISGVNDAPGGALVTRWIRPEDATWTIDNSYGTTTGYCTGLIVWRGQLYQGVAADAGASARIRQRSQAGVWTTVYTSDGTGAGNYVGPFLVVDEGARLLAFQAGVSGGAAPLVRILQSTDGVTWSTAYDVSAGLSNAYSRSGMPLLDDNGDAYWPIASGTGIGGLLKRSAAGAWGVLLSGLTTLRGPLGIIRPQLAPAAVACAVEPAGWIQRQAPTTYNNLWRSIAWSPTLEVFVVVGTQKAGADVYRVMTSPDGITWTMRAAASVNDWQSVKWAPALSLFVAVGLSGAVMTSPDGVTWTSRTASEANHWIDLAWSPSLGRLVAVAASGTHRVMTSPDGVTWTNRTVSLDTWESVIWCASIGRFVAAAVTGTPYHTMYSSDGIAWTDVADPFGIDSMNERGLIWSEDLGLAVAIMRSNNNVLWTSPDGITWTAGTVPTTAGNVANRPVWRGGCVGTAQIVIVGEQGYQDPGFEDPNQILASPDGFAWSEFDPAENDVPIVKRWSCIAWAPALARYVVIAQDDVGDPNDGLSVMTHEGPVT